MSAMNLVREIGNISDADYDHNSVDYSRHVELSDKDLVRIDRLRLLTDPGFPVFDVSYCWGTMRDGTHVRVSLDEFQFPRKGLTAALVAMAKRNGRYAKGMGLLDNISILF